MAPRFVLLWTDAVLFALLAAFVAYVWHARRDPNLRATWRKVFTDAPSMCSALVLGAFLVVTVLDSVHFRPALARAPGTPVAYDTRTLSLLDTALAGLVRSREASYSLPLATRGFLKETRETGASSERVFPRLAHGGAHLADPDRDWAPDVLARAALGAAGGLAVAALALLAAAAAVAPGSGTGLRGGLVQIVRNRTRLPLRAALLTVAVIAVLAGMAGALMFAYHVLGTDRTGNDVLYQALKSVRTAFVIGSLATLATLPLAIAFGVAAGYFRGWVDEVIQYLYTTLSSVPNVLLIAACVLMVQVYIDQNPDRYATGAERADLRLFLLCVILGLTGWATLCRLLRAETLKLRELEYVQAATAFGVGHWRIMRRHILPNVMHLVLITTVLEFSGLILYEAVLSYVGVGVDPSMNSFGGMINLARSEMSRDPVVWWSFAAAFVFMVTLVLATNLFADGVRDAFDPRSRTFRPRAAPPAPAAGVAAAAPLPTIVAPVTASGPGGTR
jgi:peptide/nickel transport system permease protein